MGRWSYFQLKRSNNTAITIITAYQVNRQPTNPIGTTAWHQQRITLDNTNRSEIHPRTAFIQDLTAFVENEHAQGNAVIIGGDFNETTKKQSSGLLRLMTSANLIEPWEHLYSGHPNFNTYARGTDQIDSIFCSPSIVASIQTIGYAPWKWISNSDHRAMIIDMNTLSLFGCITHSPSTRPNTRILKTNDKKMVKQFLIQAHLHLTSNNAFALAQKVIALQATNEEVEQLDRLIGDAGDSAEKRCKKRRPEFYSQTLTQLRFKKAITGANVQMLRNGLNQKRDGLLLRIERSGLDFTISENPQDAYAEHKAYCHDLRDAIRESLDIRIREQEYIEKRQDNNDDKEVKRIRSIRKKEATRRLWQSWNFIKRQTKPFHPIDRVDIPASWPPPHATEDEFQQLEDPKECNTWQTITDPNDIEFYVRLRNRKHFGQSQGTPFTLPPLSTHISWSADTPLSEDILQSTPHATEQLNTFDLPPQCRSLLDFCKMTSELDSLPYEITAAEFSGKIRNWKESTTTSPSGRHLGRYKALYTQFPKSADPAIKEETEMLTSHQTEMREAIRGIINHCLHHGYVLHRWKKILNAMIFKEHNNHKIHRLRVIHIYEADLNLIFAIKWQQLLHHADHTNQLNNGLFGGRPGCEAQSLPLLEELKYDISLTSRRSLFNFDNDASSCYDRIIINLASLISRKYGIHRNVTSLHANTLMNAAFHLRTLDGSLSHESYSHSPLFPIHGSGQGSGNSPCIWLLISSTLCDTHTSLSHGATFTSPDGSESVTTSMVGYVDDCTGTYNSFHPQHELTAEEMTNNMQSNAQTWNDILWSSGGMLDPNFLIQAGWNTDSTDNKNKRHHHHRLQHRTRHTHHTQRCL